MQHVADKDAALAARPGVDHDIARGMAGIALEPQPVIKRVIVADEERLPRLDDRQDTVPKGARMRRVDAAVMDALPMVVFALRHDIARLREGRDPLAIGKPGVPADMVPMQMRAHDVVDVFRLDPEAGQILDEWALHAVELRPGGALLVVADAGVDQDRVPAGFDDKAVKAEDQLAGARLNQPRAQQRRILLDHRRVEIREEVARGEERALIIGDAGNFEIADPGGLHLSSHQEAGGSRTVAPSCIW